MKKTRIKLFIGVLIFFLANYQRVNITNHQEQSRNEAGAITSPVSADFLANTELGQGEIGEALGLIDKEGNAEALADHINDLGVNPDQLTQEIDTLVKILSDMGYYDEFDIFEREFYKKGMLYLQLLNYFRDATSFIDKGYARFSELFYEDGIINGKISLLSPEYVNKYDTTYQSPDLPSIGKLVNGMPFSIVYFAHLGHWTDYEYDNDLPQIDFGQHFLNELDRVTVEEETYIVPSYMLNGLLSGIKVDEGYYIARNQKMFEAIRLRTQFYVSMFNYQIAIRQSSDNSLLFICFPTKETAKRSKWLLEHAEELGVETASHINNEGEITPDEVYELYEKVEKVINYSKEELGEIEDEFSALFD